MLKKLGKAEQEANSTINAVNKEEGKNTGPEFQSVVSLKLVVQDKRFEENKDNHYIHFPGQENEKENICEVNNEATCKFKKNPWSIKKNPHPHYGKKKPTWNELTNFS